MHGLIREEHVIKNGMGAKFVAQHLAVRTRYGKAVVIAAKPHSIISAVRKQWLILVRKKQKERASTLNSTRKQQLMEDITYMNGRRFTLKYPPDDYTGDIYVATPEAALLWPPGCQTIYILPELEAEQLHMVTAWMSKNALVVVLRQEK